MQDWKGIKKALAWLDSFQPLHAQMQPVVSDTCQTTDKIVLSSPLWLILNPEWQWIETFPENVLSKCHSITCCSLDFRADLKTSEAPVYFVSFLFSLLYKKKKSHINENKLRCARLQQQSYKDLKYIVCNSNVSLPFLLKYPQYLQRQIAELEILGSPLGWYLKTGKYAKV